MIQKLGYRAALVLNVLQNYSYSICKFTPVVTIWDMLCNMYSYQLEVPLVYTSSCCITHATEWYFSVYKHLLSSTCNTFFQRLTIFPTKISQRAWVLQIYLKSKFHHLLIQTWGRKFNVYCINIYYKPSYLSLIHIWRCRRYAVCRSRWSPYH